MPPRAGSLPPLDDDEVAELDAADVADRAQKGTKHQLWASGMPALRAYGPLRFSYNFC